MGVGFLFPILVIPLLLANLYKNIYGMGYIGYDKSLFVPKFTDLLVIGQKRLFYLHFPILVKKRSP
jgi:hypothetical protein